MKYLIIMLPLLFLMSLPNTSQAKKGDKGNPSVSGKGAGPSNSAYEHANEKARFKRSDVDNNEELNKEKTNKKKSKNKKDDVDSEKPEQETIHHNKDRDRERDGKNDKSLKGEKEKGHGQDQKGKKK